MWALGACGADNGHLARPALAVLLEPMLQLAPPGATIVVYTAAMRAHVEQALRDAGRGDLIVCQQDAPPAADCW